MTCSTSFKILTIMKGVSKCALSIKETKLCGYCLSFVMLNAVSCSVLNLCCKSFF